MFFLTAKAFDKVNYRIRFGKVAKQNLEYKLGRWIKEFLTKRKLKLVGRGSKSNKDVLSEIY